MGINPLSLRAYYEQGLTQVQIAARFGVTRQAVSQRLDALGVEKRPPPVRKERAQVRTIIGNASNVVKHTAVLEGLRAGLPQTEIAARVGITRSHVASIKKRHYARWIAALQGSAQ